MAYYSGSKIDVISDLASEIESALSNISEELSSLENIDWNEIFSYVPDSDSLQSDIENTIGAIRDNLDDLK